MLAWIFGFGALVKGRGWVLHMVLRKVSVHFGQLYETWASGGLGLWASLGY